MPYAKIAVPAPLGQAFTYALPDHCASARPGTRVVCELGSRRVLGVVLEVSSEPPGDIELDRIKPVHGIIDDEPALPEELLAFLLALSRYYLAPVGEVMRLALPAVERSLAELRGQQTLLEETKVTQVGRLLQRARATGDGEAPEQLGEKTRNVLERLRRDGPALLGELSASYGNARSAVRRLEQLGLAVVERVALDKDPFVALRVERDVPPCLTDAQKNAVRALVRALDANAARSFVLQGVTASGKTEVYLHAVARCLELGGSAIVLVPEIALTPQLVARFRARLGEGIAVLHSGLTESDRHAMWKRLRSGELRVAVGARSALFAPASRLRLVCVDEEHDGSFKQEEGVRYNARDMALLRAHRAGAVCVLGSATPSLMSEAAVRGGKLERLRLPDRARPSAALPSVQIVDLKRIGAGPTGERLLSLPLHRALEHVLAERQQAILFLNRRGFAPSVVCEGCGELLSCPDCSVALTLHRRGQERLICHYCGHHRTVPAACPKCGSPSFSLEGTGTERIETHLAEAFPEARIGRLDRDVAGGVRSEPVLERMRQGAIDILVGTQMVTKGHDLPRVTLVGVLNADAALSMPDFRASERTFQLLVQVAGRAGRGTDRGTVIVQTRQPDHPAITLAAAHDVDAFLEREMRDREELGYPPFSRLALVKLEGLDEAETRAEAGRLAALARRSASREVTVVGPAPAPLARLRRRFRFRFMLRSPAIAPLRQPLLRVLRAGAKRPVRLIVDVDPMSML
ncbi:MAG: primosomal protein N' [Polyangiaceae bacterium]|nr:primosomal protein N' [Polyangiaceae bacterium]